MSADPRSSPRTSTTSRRCSTTRTGRCCTGCGRSWTTEVQPIINEYWTRAKTPRHLIPGMAELGHRRHPVLRLRLPGEVDAARRHDRHGALPGRPVDLHVHGRPRRAGDGHDLPLRLRGAEGALAAGHGADGADRRVRPHRARLRLRRRPRAADDGPPGRRHLGAQRPEEVDRQRQLRRPGHHLGAGRGDRAGARLRRREGHRGLLRPSTSRTRSRCGRCRTR